MVFHVLVFIRELGNFFTQDHFVLSNNIAILIEHLLDVFHLFELSAQTLRLLTQHLITLLLPLKLLDAVVSRSQLFAMSLLHLTHLLLFLSLHLLELLIRFVCYVERLALVLLPQLIHFATLLNNIGAKLVLGHLVVAAHVLQTISDVLKVATAQL